jgi:hypothetical protein
MHGHTNVRVVSRFIRALIQYHSGDQIKENKMRGGEGRACGNYGREERWIQEFWLGNQSERHHFKYPGTDGGVIKWVFRKINTGTRGGLLLKQYQAFNFHKTPEISWLADQLLATEA